MGMGIWEEDYEELFLFVLSDSSMETNLSYFFSFPGLSSFPLPIPVSSMYFYLSPAQTQTKESLNLNSIE